MPVSPSLLLRSAQVQTPDLVGPQLNLAQLRQRQQQIDLQREDTQNLQAIREENVSLKRQQLGLQKFKTLLESGLYKEAEQSFNDAFGGQASVKIDPAKKMVTFTDPNGNKREGVIDPRNPQKGIEVIPVFEGGEELDFSNSRVKAASPEGKIIQDREAFINQYGVDSPQVKAFDEATKATGAKAKLSDERGIRQEFTKASGDFVKVRDSYGRIQAVTADPSAAGDLSLIFNFMKMLDPGSVVRESEFATAENTAGVPARIRNIYNKVLSGERLGPEIRQDFLNQADNLYRSQLRFQTKLEEQFRRIARSSNIRPEKVIVDFKQDFASAEQAAPTPPSEQKTSIPDIPDNIQTESKAVEFIQREFGMDFEEAKQFLKQNYTAEGKAK